MANDAPQRLFTEELDVLLQQAKAERWTELALLGSDSGRKRKRPIPNDWPAARVFVLSRPLRKVPPALIAIESLAALELRDNHISAGGAMAIARLTSLTALGLSGNQIGDTGAEAIASLTSLTSLDLEYNWIGDAGVEAIASLTGLTSLGLSSNRIGAMGAEAIARLAGLTSLDLDDNEIGATGAEAIARLTGLTSLNLRNNQTGDAGAEAIARLAGLTSLDLMGNQIGATGAAAIAGLTGLTSLNFGLNLLGDAGTKAIAKLTDLIWLNLRANRIGVAGARAILDAWADPATAERRRYLNLRDNDNLDGLLPAKVLRQTDAQMIIAAWRERQDGEVGRAPLPEPEAVGEPVAHGVQVAAGSDGRLALVDRPLAERARDDAVGRELHGEVVLALDRLIATAGRSNVVAEWREAAEATKERLGSGPTEMKVSAILRIERLRSLREVDERRRSEPDPMVEPAEAGVAAALRDAVAAANLYIETDPYLAEQQRRLAEPGLDIAISTEEAEAAEAEMEEFDVADPALLAELRLGREVAAASGRAGERARAWLAGSWRNVVREMLRQVLALVRAQVKAVRAGAGEAAMQAKLGTVITVDEAKAVLDAMGLQAKVAAAKAGHATLGSLGRMWLAAEPEIGKGVGQAVKWGLLVLLVRHLDLLPRLGWSTDFVAAIGRLLGQTL